MRLKELTDKDHPEYWKTRSIDALDPEGRFIYSPKDHPPEIQTQEWIDRLQKALTIVEANCREIVSIYKQAGRWIFRGARGRGKDIFVAGIRPDRKSMYLDNDIHALEPFAVKQMGGVANRTNSIFCTTSWHMASGWGDNVYVVFPKDGWHVTYFTRLARGEYVFDRISGIPYNNDTTIIMNMIQKKYRGAGVNFDKSKLPAYIQKDRHDSLELLITGDSYIGIEWNKYSYLLGLWLQGKPLNTKPKSIKDIRK